MTSTLLQIRGLAPSTRDELAARAARRGQSLSSYLRDLLEREVAQPEVATVLDRAAAREGSSDISGVDIIRRDRDAR